MRAWLARLDGRDFLGLAGLCLLVYGGETLYPGAGAAVGGAALLYVAVFVR